MCDFQDHFSFQNFSDRRKFLRNYQKFSTAVRCIDLHLQSFEQNFFNSMSFFLHFQTNQRSKDSREDIPDRIKCVMIHTACNFIDTEAEEKIFISYDDVLTHSSSYKIQKNAMFVGIHSFRFNELQNQKKYHFGLYYKFNVHCISEHDLVWS